MTVRADEASAALADIEAIARRVKQSAIYRVSGVILMGWGPLIVIGNVCELFAGRWTIPVWAALDLFGAAMTVALIARANRGRGAPWLQIHAFALFFAFGLAWSGPLGRFTPRQDDAFWPMLFLFGYSLAGLFFGRAFVWLGLGLGALVLAGYIWAGESYNLYLAAVNGGGFILCGYWMRRA